MGLVQDIVEKGDEAIQAAEDVGNRELAERVRGLQDAVSRVPDWMVD
ncbi:MAG: hypothetical protein IS632_02490 [Thaumarchaeota archaeon]|nr:hypothetical protein [Nitrososphaerota archaeon]